MLPPDIKRMYKTLSSNTYHLYCYLLRHEDKFNIKLKPFTKNFP